MKIAYLGYDFFYGCLQDLISDGHEVLKVFSFPTDQDYDFNDNVQHLSQSAGASFQTSRITKEDISNLESLGCEMIVSAGYPFKVPCFEGQVPYGINIHPSLLPIGRGVWPMPWVIFESHERSGVTLHKLSQNWDAGDIVLQESIPLMEKETLETLSFKSQQVARKLLRQFMSSPKLYWDKARPQVGAYMYWSFPPENKRTLDWNATVEQIDRTVRAFGKFQSYAIIGDEKIFVADAVCWKEHHSYIPGDVIHKSNKEWVVAAADGMVCVRIHSKDQKGVYE